MSLEEVRSRVAHEGPFDYSTCLYPTGCTWGMGFAWSSFVAQSVLLHACQLGGFGTDRFVADDKEDPEDISTCCALATDDLMHFTTLGSCAVARDMCAIDCVVSLTENSHIAKDWLIVCCR